MKTAIGHFLVLVFFALLSACGSNSSNGPDTSSCPGWKLDDSMTYRRVKTKSVFITEPIVFLTETSMTYMVTGRTADSATLSDGTTTKIYSVVAGQYIPLSEQVSPEPADDYISTTAFCPPPAVGEKYEYATWIPGPWEGTGEYITMTLSVTGVSIESVSVPAGVFTAKKIVMDKVSAIKSATVTRYYVGGIGVVKEVEDIPADNTTITDELTAYSYQ